MPDARSNLATPSVFPCVKINFPVRPKLAQGTGVAEGTGDGVLLTAGETADGQTEQAVSHPMKRASRIFFIVR